MKIMTIFGTRPEGIKMVPILKQIENDPNLESISVNTGQHLEMLDNVLQLFFVTPTYDLKLMQQGQTLESLSSKMIVALSEIVNKENPDVVLVQGDTTTTFCGAYVAFLNEIPVGHVEAGLRTHNKYSPYPEEINRQLVTRLTDFHFACTEGNKANLLKENISSEDISVVGNTVIDALHLVLSQSFSPAGWVEELLEIEGKVLLVTTHRRENLELLQNIYKAINLLVQKVDDLHVVFPVHKNPRVREQVQMHLMSSNRIHITEPLEYDAFCHLMNESYMILTDSGGIQEEACALGVPVLLTRENTERPEGLGNSVKLVGTETDRIVESFLQLLNNEEQYQKMKNVKDTFGDGNASSYVIRFLKNRL